jgi:hypothetical protein
MLLRAADAPPLTLGGAPKRGSMTQTMRAAAIPLARNSPTNKPFCVMIIILKQYIVNLLQRNIMTLRRLRRRFSFSRACDGGAPLVDRPRLGNQAGAFALVFDIGPRRQFA